MASKGRGFLSRQGRLADASAEVSLRDQTATARAAQHGRGDPEDTERRHTLSDWLTLHELDPPTCRRLLAAANGADSGKPSVHSTPERGYQALGLDDAWSMVVAAMGRFLPAHRDTIDDTFENIAKVVVDRNDGSRRALTLDNGPAAYPTILFGYRGEPADLLIMAHEFGHALQIRASRGRFVSPIMRELCAFLGEGALLSHARQEDIRRYDHLAHAWRSDSCRYFGVQKNRLTAALSRAAAPYRYSWNYPLARHFADRIPEHYTPEAIWTLFEGGVSVRQVVAELALLPR